MYQLYNDLNSNDPKVKDNSLLNIKLKEHQKTAIHAMLCFENNGKVIFQKEAYIKNYNIYENNIYNLHRNYIYKNYTIEIESNYGILADKVGSGKTYMILGLICNNLIPKDRSIILSSSIYSVMRYYDMQKCIKTNLIIVPHNLTIQWKEAFQNSNLKTYVIIKNIDIDIDINDIENYDVIIISSTMFDRFYHKNKEIKWARIILDEVISIKLPSDLEFNCNFLWFITATPSGLKYIKRTYIRLLINSINMYTIENIIIKNNDNFVDESMKLPNINQIVIKCFTPRELYIIKNYVDIDIINMINAGNIQDAAIKLNCNIETSEHILEILTKKIKKDIYNKKIELEYEEKRIPDDIRIHQEKIKKIQEKINSLEIQLNSIEEKISKFKDDSCPICYEDFTEPFMLSCCNNLFCLRCITSCNKCPLCREIIKMNEGVLITNNNIIVKNKNLCSKIDNLITLLLKKKNGKFLIFSNYDRTFDNIYDKLNENKIKFSRLIGSNIVIKNTIKQFESGNIQVLLLNATNYGSGLNLQMATDIIIYHELDQELETQVIGRAQRLGRTISLNVYYLLYDNEKINCINPTLNLDIFKDDTKMLEDFIDMTS